MPSIDLRAVSELFDIDRRDLTDDQTVDLLMARQRLINHLMAERAADIVEVCTRTGTDPSDIPVRADEFHPLEVGCALTLTRRASVRETTLSFELVRRLPAVWSALSVGDIDWARARTFVDGLDHLDPITAREIAERALPEAPGLTTGKLAALLRRLCLDHDPDDARDRYAKSVKDRTVMTFASNDGTGTIHGFNLPADRLNQAMGHVEALARQQGDDRTIDQKRADVFLDLLSGRCSHLHRGATTQLDVTVDLETLLGLRDRAAHIPGWGPVITDIARQALDGQDHLKVTVADADASVAVTARAPSVVQRRIVRHRYPTCIFPGCRMPATRSDIDHRIRHADGGKTRIDGLAPLCRYHHRAKDEGGWRYDTTDEGTIIWISPLGRRYTSDPRGP
jgi:hypothetical protein